MQINPPPVYHKFSLKEILSFFTVSTNLGKKDPYEESFIWIPVSHIETLHVDTVDGSFYLKLDDGTRFELTKPLDLNADYVFITTTDKENTSFYGQFYGRVELTMNKEYLVLKFHEYLPLE